MMQNIGIYKSFPLRARLRVLEHMLGGIKGAVCLAVGSGDEQVDERLRDLGGMWTCVDIGSLREEPDGKHGGALRRILPYKEGMFERVVVLDQLLEVRADYLFMAECHRVLKPGGLLVVDVPHDMRWTVWRPMRRLLGAEPEALGRVRAGYTERGLFDVLKDGFDVQEARTYSRFFSEGVDTFVRMTAGALGWAGDTSTDPSRGRFARFMSVMHPVYQVASWLDFIVFFTGGYRMAAVARRRIWKPRRVPVLRDGRTIADAAINTKIGTATLFE